MSLLHGGVGEITQSERRLKFIGINVLRWSSTACHPNQIRSAGTAGGLRNPPLKSHAHGIANDGNRCIGARQGRKLDGADSMTASEKPRKINLEIGGTTRMSLTGRSRPVRNSDSQPDSCHSPMP